MNFIKTNNLAFIDGQNLHLGTIEDGWKVDLNKLRIYLKDKYSISNAFYFLGCKYPEHQDLYDNLNKAGFMIIFREHGRDQLAKKKGNVDCDIIFELMKSLIENQDFSKIVIISGDGDYKKMINYLIIKNRFEKILFPNRRYFSSLYDNLGSEFFDFIDNIKTSIILSKTTKGS